MDNMSSHENKAQTKSKKSMEVIWYFLEIPLLIRITMKIVTFCKQLHIFNYILMLLLDKIRTEQLLKEEINQNQ